MNTPMNTPVNDPFAPDFSLPLTPVSHDVKSHRVNVTGFNGLPFVITYSGAAEPDFKLYTCNVQGEPISRLNSSWHFTASVEGTRFIRGFEWVESKPSKRLFSAVHLTPTVPVETLSPDDRKLARMYPLFSHPAVSPSYIVETCLAVFHSQVTVEHLAHFSIEVRDLFGRPCDAAVIADIPPLAGLGKVSPRASLAQVKQFIIAHYKPERLYGQTNPFMNSEGCYGDKVVKSHAQRLLETGRTDISRHEDRSGKGITVYDQTVVDFLHTPVPTVVYSDDQQIHIEFDAARYFQHCLYADHLEAVLNELVECEFGGDTAADSVAEYFCDSVTQPLFQYLDIALAHSDEMMGFECEINQPSLTVWLENNAPQWRGLLSV